MPVDYSKWDALELSDDSDIEVHPNVDKRSFIRAKQNQIHQERSQRKNQIEVLKYERQINDGLIRRISALLASLRSHAAEAATKNAGEIAFRAVLESAGKPEDDQPPARPEGLAPPPEGQEQPTYSKMMAELLDQVNKALDEKKPGNRYEAMVEEIEGHEDKVKKLQQDLIKELERLQKEEGSKITSEGYRDGFSSSHVNKSNPAEGEEPKKKESTVELLNPNVPSLGAIQAESNSKSVPGSGSGDGDDDDEEIEASPAAKKFAQIKSNEYSASLSYLQANPEILSERETDGLLVMAFDAALEKKDEYSRQCVHQALLLQYCRALGRDGVAMFFKRITTQGHKAQDMFFKDVQDTYMRIRNRSREIIAERLKEEEQGGVEQIQLHPMEPGQVINITVPPEGADTDEGKEARRIFEGFRPEMKKALESGDLEIVNRELGQMKVDEAEELVGLFGEAGILSLEEELIDATTEEGKQQLRDMEEAAAKERAEAAASGGKRVVDDYAGDPE